MNLPKYTLYKTNSALQFNDYTEIKWDLEQVKKFSKYYTENYKFSEFFKIPDEDRQLENHEIIPMISIATTIVVSYTRCFDKASRRRKVKLDSGFLIGFDKELIETHKTFMSLRHNFYAHAGNSEFEKHEINIGIELDGAIAVKFPKDNFKIMTNTYVEYQSIEPLVDALLDKINIEMKKLEQKIHEELILMKEDSQNIIDKIFKNKNIENQDIEKCRKILNANISKHLKKN